MAHSGVAGQRGRRVAVHPAARVVRPGRVGMRWWTRARPVRRQDRSMRQRPQGRSPALDVGVAWGLGVGDAENFIIQSLVAQEAQFRPHLPRVSNTSRHRARAGPVSCATPGGSSRTPSTRAPQRAPAAPRGVGSEGEIARDPPVPVALALPDRPVRAAAARPRVTVPSAAMKSPLSAYAAAMACASRRRRPGSHAAFAASSSRGGGSLFEARVQLRASAHQAPISRACSKLASL